MTTVEDKGSGIPPTFVISVLALLLFVVAISRSSRRDIEIGAMAATIAGLVHFIFREAFANGYVDYQKRMKYPAERQLSFANVLPLVRWGSIITIAGGLILFLELLVKK